jgi:hypothetical protein
VRRVNTGKVLTIFIYFYNPPTIGQVFSITPIVFGVFILEKAGPRRNLP